MLKRIPAALAIGLGMLCVLCLPSASHAQAVYGSLFGNVTDNTGAAIPGATITITDDAKGTSVTTQSGPSGEYSVEHLIPDSYNIKVTYTGFQTSETKGLQVSADTSQKVDVKMTVGGESTTIEVNADTVPVLKTDRADVSTVFDAKTVSDLPVGDRNFTNLQLLLPGAQALSWAHAADENPQASKQIQVDGQAFGGTAFELDGTDNQDPILGIIVINPALDSVAETKVTTQNFDAEFGKAISSVVTAQTKSGSNKFHGSAFDYRQSNANLASDPYHQYPAPGVSSTKGLVPAGLSNQFGGSIGGPILKDRLFFFADYQGLRQKVGTSATSDVPTRTLVETCLGKQAPNAASGQTTGCDFSDYMNSGGKGNGIVYQNNGTPYAGNVVPGALISPQALAMFAILEPYSLDPRTVAVVPGTTTGIANNYSASGTGLFNNNQWDERVDFTLSEKTHLFERFSRFTDTLSGASLFGPLGGQGFGIGNYGGKSTGANDSVAAGVDIAISSTLLTDFRLGYYRYDIIDAKNDQGVNFADTLGMPGLNTGTIATSGSPEFNISVPGSGGNQYGNGLATSHCNCPLIEKEDQFQIVNNWTKIIRTHSIKVGADLRYARNLRVPSDNDRTGLLSFSNSPTQYLADNAIAGQYQLPSGYSNGGLGWATLALGSVTGFNRYVSTSTNAKEFQKRDFFYVQDTWRVTPNLTLNLGLRYEFYFPEKVNAKGNGSLMDLGTGYLHVAGYGNVPSNMGWNKSAFPFNPRIGVAYQFDPKTVIRSGYGRSFDIGVFGSMFGHVVTQNLPVLANQQINSPSTLGNSFCLGPGSNGCDPTLSQAGQPAGGGPSTYAFPDVPANGLLASPGSQINSKARPTTLRMPTVDAWNLSIQRAVTPTLSVTVAYVANKSTHNLSAGDSNTTNPNEPGLVLPAQYSLTGQTLHWDSTASNSNTPAADGGTSNPLLLRRYYGGTLAACQDPNYATPAGFAAGQCGWSNDVSYYGDNQNSHFSALQVTVNKQLTHGLQVTSNYAWQRGTDYAAGYATWDRTATKGRNNDIREQQIVTYGLWELPFGKNMMFASGAPGWAQQVIGGWQLSPVISYAGGLPFTLTYGECNLSVGGTSAPCYVNGKASHLKTSLSGLNTVSHTHTYFQAVTLGGDFTAPALDTIGTGGRNNAWGPHYFNTDLALQKNFPIRESLFAQFRVDAANVFNHINPSLGGGGGSANVENTLLLNQSTGVNGVAPTRQLKFSLRVQF